MNLEIIPSAGLAGQDPSGTPNTGVTEVRHQALLFMWMLGTET